MKTCPDCISVDKQVEGDARYEVIDIGEHVKNLKEFLRLRDNNAVFDDAKKYGYAGIPCFVLVVKLADNACRQNRSQGDIIHILI